MVFVILGLINEYHANPQDFCAEYAFGLVSCTFLFF